MFLRGAIVVVISITFLNLFNQERETKNVNNNLIKQIYGGRASQNIRLSFPKFGF